MRTRPARIAPQMVHQTMSCVRTRGSGFMHSGSDRMPRGLELEEITQLVEALRLVRVPIGLFLGLEQLGALHALGGAELERLALVGVRDARDRTQVGVRGHRRDDLLAKA